MGTTETQGWYLGKNVADGARVDYVGKHLTTHGLVFGMTGSGKTGLSATLLEEAARSGVPVIAIDPKGDLTNLALSWPSLDAANFAAWIDPAKAGASPADAHAAGERSAAAWSAGLAADGLGAEDIRALRQRTHVTVYTPGSTAGVPVSVLDQFVAPAGWRALPEEDRAELVGGIAAALLALVNLDADPIQSKEYILLSNILSSAWDAGESLDLAKVIQRVDAPPFAKLGVFSVDDFFPPKKRREFAMQLNGLVASPSFQAWLEGQPLDIDRLLQRTPSAQRLSVFYLAHLDDAERMSFVTLLLDRIIAWMRSQPGTGELRALLYMDEVFGYLPPHPASPASKRPLLTLLKQARAFGLGVLLATQNPVDIDYKALTNAGTWLVGKLQAEQDRERLLDGLVSATSASGKTPSRSELSRMISGLESRQFLLHDASDGADLVFKTRWALSFLRGPLTRQEVARLRAARFYNLPETAALDADVVPAVVARAAPAEPGWPTHAPIPAPATAAYVQTQVPTPIPRTARRIPPLEARFLSPAALARPTLAAFFGAAPRGPWSYHPALMAEARLTFPIDALGSVTTGTVRHVAYPLPANAAALAWTLAELPADARDFVPAEPGARFEPLPAWLDQPSECERAKDALIRSLIATQRVTVPVCPSLMRTGEPGETLDAFRTRLGQQVQRASGSLLGKLHGRQSLETALFDQELASLRELLAADQRELGFLKAQGDAEALARATERVRWRMGKFREAKERREGFARDHARASADVEFAALDHLAACELRTVTLTPKHITAAFFGLLWVPAG